MIVRMIFLIKKGKKIYYSDPNTQEGLKYRRELYDRYLELLKTKSEYKAKIQLLNELQLYNHWGTGLNVLAQLISHEKARRNLNKTHKEDDIN